MDCKICCECIGQVGPAGPTVTTQLSLNDVTGTLDGYAVTTTEASGINEIINFFTTANKPPRAPNYLYNIFIQITASSLSFSAIYTLHYGYKLDHDLRAIIVESASLGPYPKQIPNFIDPLPSIVNGEPTIQSGSNVERVKYYIAWKALIGSPP